MKTQFAEVLVGVGLRTMIEGADLQNVWVQVQAPLVSYDIFLLMCTLERQQMLAQVHCDPE